MKIYHFFDWEFPAVFVLGVWESSASPVIIIFYAIFRWVYLGGYVNIMHLNVCEFCEINSQCYNPCTVSDILDDAIDGQCPVCVSDVVNHAVFFNRKHSHHGVFHHTKRDIQRQREYELQYSPRHSS